MLSLLLSLLGALQLPVLVSDTAVQIGEPIHCTVDLSEFEGAMPVLAEQDLDPSSPWAVVSAPVIERSAGRRTVLSWSCFALEPEPGELPIPLLSFSGEIVELIAPTIDVDGALAEADYPAEKVWDAYVEAVLRGEGWSEADLLRELRAADAQQSGREDAPRPARGFLLPGMNSEASGSRLWWLPLGGLVALVFRLWWLPVGGLVALVLVLRSLHLRFGKEADPEQSPSSRLEQLRSEMDGDMLRVADLHSELTHILRTAFGDESSGWSDEEWVERAELSESQRADLRGVFSSCAEVKYGGARPARFAVEETLQRAQALISQTEEVAA